MRLASFESVSGENLYKPSPKPLDLEFPVAILDFLLGHTSLEDVEIAGWTLPETASGHKILFSDTSNLKTIRLPVSNKAPTIHLFFFFFHLMLVGPTGLCRASPIYSNSPVAIVIKL